MMQLSEASRATLAAHSLAAQGLLDGLWAALVAAGSRGADAVSEAIQGGETGLKAQHGGSGLAGAVRSWPIDKDSLLVAVGVPADSPASAYAAIQDYGGLILPKKGKALAVPISAEARNVTGPLDMKGLSLLPRSGRPPLLVRMLKRPGKGGRTFIPHWVLVGSVRIRATGWFRRSFTEASGAVQETFEAVFGDWLKGTGAT